MSTLSSRRAGAWIGLTVTVVALTLSVSAAGATTHGSAGVRGVRSSADPPVEQLLLQLINADRARAGVAPVASDAYLDGYARNHVWAVARAGAVFHSDITSLLDTYMAAAENVAAASDIGAAHTQFVVSGPHYQNMVYPGYTRVGIGAVPAGGQVFLVYVFAD